jgi:hypothetical protein
MIPNAAIDSIIKDNSRENRREKQILCQEKQVEGVQIVTNTKQRKKSPLFI